MNPYQKKIGFTMSLIIGFLFPAFIIGLLYIVFHNIIKNHAFCTSNYRIQQFIERDPQTNTTFQVRTDIYLEYRNTSVNIKKSQIDEHVNSGDIFSVLEKQQSESEKIIEKIKENYKRRALE